MAVWQRWVLACGLSCTMWSLPGPLALVGLLLGGLPMTLLLRPVVGGWRSARLTWALALYVVLMIPIGFVVVASMYAALGDWGAFAVGGVVGGSLLGVVHALVFADWVGWHRWIAGGAVAGPTVLLVFWSWSIGIPLGFVPGAVYGLATMTPATWAIGRLQEAHP